MRKVVVRSALVSSVGLLAASSASAQEAPGTPSDPAPPLPADVRSPPMSWLPTPPQEPADRARLRVCLDVDGGAGAGGGQSGGVLGGKVRFGWQFNNRMAAYLQGAIFWWATSSKVSADRTVSAKGVIGAQATPLFSLTPSDVIEIAAGPSLDHLLTAQSSSTADGGSTATSTRTSSGDAVTYSGNYWGMHGRVAWHIGARLSADADTSTPKDSCRREGFTLGGDVHTTFAEGSVQAFFTIGVGGDWY